MSMVASACWAAGCCLPGQERVVGSVSCDRRLFIFRSFKDWELSKKIFGQWSSNFRCSSSISHLLLLQTDRVISSVVGKEEPKQMCNRISNLTVSSSFSVSFWVSFPLPFPFIILILGSNCKLIADNSLVWRSTPFGTSSNAFTSTRWRRWRREGQKVQIYLLPFSFSSSFSLHLPP